MYIDLGADGGSSKPVGMQVDPDNLLQLKKGFEEERDRVRSWLRDNRLSIGSIPPPGNDRCSEDTMDVMGRNGQSAVDTAHVYIDQLNSVINKMHESAIAYGVIEDDTKDEFRQESE